MMVVVQMDNFDNLLDVNLDDNEDGSCSISCDESDSVDPNDLCDHNECGSMDIGNGKFKRIIDLTADEI